MPYVKRKVDLNQKEIVQQLRALGYSVRHTHTIGKGFPDIAIGKNQFTALVEIKRPGETLTPDEKEFFQIWKGAAWVGYDALSIHETFEATFLEREDR